MAHKKPSPQAYNNVKNTKELFDLIGKYIKEKVHSEALDHSKSELHGFLSKVVFSGGEKTKVFKECDIDKEFETNVTDGNSDPCGNRPNVRFSDIYEGQCTDSKIRGNDQKQKIGACAPLRRLSLCDTNLEHIDAEKIKNTHSLYVDVLLAAKHEGQMIANKLQEYDATNYESRICTELARSFADIGDIIRGKDLYLGNKKRNENLREKQKLEIKLKSFFEQIYNSLEEKEKKHYGGDENYFQLREDWWDLNRHDVWKAITCSAPNEAKYNVIASDGTTTKSNYKKCRNVADVTTYFDYVPQFLRWFEEWAEDFCRKKKKYVDIVKTYCRGVYNNEPRYCSRNGHDCEQTINKIGKLVIDKGCINCLYACNGYEKWIDNKKKEFLKQKEKYAKEVSGNSRKKRSELINKYEGYDRKFYKELQEHYSIVDKFLNLLNKENECTNIDTEGGKIDFTKPNDADDDNNNDKEKGTFYRSIYCQVCPNCGVKHTGKGEFTEKVKNNGNCEDEQLYEPPEDIEPTEINVLISGDGNDDIGKKLEQFCTESQNESLYEEWKCYYKDAQNEACILNKQIDNKVVKKQKSYNNFFLFWVAHMLKDSIHWRTKRLKRCLKNKKTCGNNKCNTDCECFQRWVKQKKDEWDEIKEHFKKQNDIGQKGVPIEFTHDGVLEWNLKLQFLNEDSTQDKQNSLNAEEIRHLREMLKETGFDGGSGIGGVTGKRTIMDKLIEHEERIVNECKKCQDPQQPPKPSSDGGARSAEHPDAVPVEHDDEDDDHSSEDSEDEGEEGTEAASETETVEAVTPTTQDTVDVCKIVETLFKDVTSLQAACEQKYGPKAPTSWKCVPTTSGDEKTTSGDKDGAGPTRAKRDASTVTATGASDTTGGSICVPPRRRRLYVGKLEQWANSSGNDTQDSGEATVVGSETAKGSTTQSPPGETSSQGDKSPQGSPPATSSGSHRDPLLTAFVESAAVETFFLWHRYKKEWEHRNKKPQDGLAGGPQLPNGGTLSGEQNPQNQLQKGDIPTDFLRQMFYTLGDYRDILFSGSKDEKSGVKDIFSGDKEMAQREKEIKGAIQKFFEQSGNNQESGSSPSPPPGPKDPSQPGDKQSENGDKTIEKDGAVYEKFFGENNKGTPGTYQSTYKTQYDYKTVKLDNSGTEDPLNNPKLSDFVEIPTFFRWLHEWGSDFCGKRARMLKNVKDNCRDGIYGERYSSGDGENCEKIGPQKDKTFSTFDYPSCAEECRKYRKWIDIKFDEFHNQKSIYQAEHDKLKANHNGDNNCCEQIEKKKNAAEFLKELKHCKDGQTGGEKVTEEDKKNNKIDFSEPLETFTRSTYCKTCPLKGVTCSRGSRRSGGKDPCTAVNGNNWESVFNSINGNGENTTDITVEMIDRRAPFIKNYLGNSPDSLFKTSRLFKGLRVQNWKCKFNKAQNKDVCKLDKFEKNIDLNEYTTFKVFLIYWLQDFIEGYYILKKKRIIDLCTKNGGETCNGQPKNYCACVKEWVDQKITEWRKIKDHFKDRKSDDGDNILSKVKNFLEELIPQISAANDKKKSYDELKKLEKSLGCNCAGRAENSKEDEKKDIVLCLLKKLEKKISECTSQSSGSPEAQCDSLAPIDTPPEEPFEEENPVTQPNICPKVETTEETVVEEEKCEQADTPSEKDKTEDEGDKDKKDDSEKTSTSSTDQEIVGPTSPSGNSENPEQTEVKPPTKPQPPSPPSIPQPRPNPPPQLLDDPLLKTALMTSTLAWSVGIGFAAFTYFYLKKKTKASVGKLFQILQIPKSDYGIPTKLSPNRYIPYTSGKYRGKRYIYLEGDSGTDSGYTDHYSDITSSSESEYEELDINDIYVPGSPKYKTLIEVVLEPSGKLSGNTIPTSGKNTTASDTQNDIQNDIQNDGIPSSKITDNEWNTLKDEFISQYLQSEQPKDVPNDYRSGDIPFNTQPNTLYFDKPQEKPFITSIHDRNLYTGEEISYNVNMSTNSMDDPKYVSNNVYSGIDLINDSLSGNQHIDIYDEILKRKENELFGTNHVKQTSIHSVAKNTNSDPIHNQLELFHKWLDRHRDMCEKWENHHERLAKLKEEWENDTSTSGNTHPSGNTPPTSDIPSGKLSDIPSDNNIPSSNQILNTDVSIQIHMDDPKPINEFSNMDTYPNNSSMDTILDDLDKPFNEPYYYDMYDDDIYYDVHDHDTSTVDTNAMDVPSKVQIEMDVNTKLVKEKYPIGDVWDI
ncbi:erythrocyte membrane protein 1 [Plasmodium falciparum IGH-CR14]|uniref:Erythrocyte membrane protein 1 n=1 Tax=Plasmodium falciparum IGH-CR14 TaxID=580059 RepID=A0A0L1I6D5_PLAFA|nr:erythrocyte membrane protein 1 [Plasmodium falciparum IGH-CR14]